MNYIIQKGFIGPNPHQPIKKIKKRGENINEIRGRKMHKRTD
jgi:hypothetical protein